MGDPTSSTTIEPFAGEPFLRPGDELGDFVIGSILGRGGMGVVYRAAQTSLGGRSVALKVLRVEGVGDAQVKRFEREARIASTLHHPNLAEVYGYGRTDEHVYLAMRIVEGPTLRNVLERLAEDPVAARDPAVRRLIVQHVTEVAQGLAAMHAAGIVHRDVKPGNVVLEAGGDPREVVPFAPAVLVDFGLVRTMDSETETVGGTISYASREQLGGGALDGRTDVFSLCVMLHDLLAARLPDDRHPPSIGLEPIEEIAPGIDPDLAAIVATGCDPMAEYRFADARILLHDLQAWLEGRPVSCRTIGRVERLRRWIRRNPAQALRATAWAVAGALVLAVATFAVSHVASVRSLNASALSALRSGDLIGLVDVLDSIGERAVSRVSRGLLDEELLALHEHVRGRASAEPGSPLVEVLRHLDAGDPAHALHVASAYYRWGSGGESHPRLERFCERFLGGDDGRIPRQLRFQALVHFAAILHESPDATPGHFEASAGVRAALLDVLKETGSGRDRLYALSGLSGCAGPEELPTLLDHLGSKAPDPADQAEARMAARCIERTVRRLTWEDLHELGGEIEHRSILEEVARIAARVPADQENLSVLGDVAVALILHRKAVVGSVDDLQAVARSVHTTRSRQDEILAALGDSDLRAGLLDGASSPHGLGAGPTGMLCGLFDDVELADEVRALLPAESRGRFDEYLALGRARLIGVRPDLRPPEGTTRTAILESLEERTLETVSVDGGPEGLIASWSFRWPVVRLAGSASSVVASSDIRFSSGEDPFRDTDDHWELFTPGRSRVRLGFHLTAEDVALRNPDRSMELRITHLSASQEYLPNRGIVHVNVYLDGDPVHENLAVSWHGDYAGRVSTSRFNVWPESLNPGLHEIEIEMAARTTSYWLFDVSLVHVE